MLDSKALDSNLLSYLLPSGSVKTPGIYQPILAGYSPSDLWGARRFPSPGSQDSTSVALATGVLIFVGAICPEKSPQGPRHQEPGPLLTCTALPKAKARALYTHPQGLQRRGRGVAGLKGHLAGAH